MTTEQPACSTPAARAAPIDPFVVAFYVLPDFTMLSLSAAVEALRLANSVLGHQAYAWRFVAENDGTAHSSCGLSLPISDSLPEERKRLFGSKRPSLAVVCGGHDVTKHSTRGLEAWLRECRRQRIAVAAIGSGTNVLAAAGLLEDRRCSVHWQNLPGFSEHFANAIPSAGLYEIDDGVWTCAGGSASFDMMMHLVERDFGEHIAAGICEQALVERVRGPGERQRLPLAYRYGVSNEAVIKAINQMELHLVEPLCMDDLAALVGLSRRQVERLFRSHLGCSPVLYYRKLRLERAGLLLTQSGMPIVDVAVACGFVSASHFSKCFREKHGLSPQEARKRRLWPAWQAVMAKPERPQIGLKRPSIMQVA